MLPLLAAGLAFGPLEAASRRPTREERDNAQLKAQLLAHISELASDAYEGREPGTEGEAKTLRYLARQWFDIGLQSGTNDPLHPWFAPVGIIGREPDVSRATFFRRGRRLPAPSEAVLALTSGKRSLVEGAPLLFVGDGSLQLTRTELAGRVALLLGNGTEDSVRQNALLANGASAVLTVLDGPQDLDAVATRRKRMGYALASEALGGDLEGFITASALDGLLAGSKQSFASLKASLAAPGFAPQTLDLAVTLEATTRETRIKTHNLIGKLPGRHPELGAVLLLAHWDHFGHCAAPPAEDQICNGAIDNASGLAVLTETARRLAKGPPLDRDVYFLATTGEEMGLLGAEAFAENPPVPLKTIVAAFNSDSVALAPAGRPFAIVGKGMTGLDGQIEAAAAAQKRKIAQGDDGNVYVRRQDGWALMRHDVPAVMVSSSWSDLALVEHFMATDYHHPSDEVRPTLELGGAADDVNFLVALARWFADPKKVPPQAQETP